MMHDETEKVDIAVFFNNAILYKKKMCRYVFIQLQQGG